MAKSSKFKQSFPVEFSSHRVCDDLDAANPGKIVGDKPKREMSVRCQSAVAHTTPVAFAPVTTPPALACNQETHKASLNTVLPLRVPLFPCRRHMSSHIAATRQRTAHEFVEALEHHTDAKLVLNEIIRFRKRSTRSHPKTVNNFWTALQSNSHIREVQLCGQLQSGLTHDEWCATIGQLGRIPNLDTLIFVGDMVPNGIPLRALTEMFQQQQQKSETQKLRSFSVQAGVIVYGSPDEYWEWCDTMANASHMALQVFEWEGALRLHQPEGRGTIIGSLDWFVAQTLARCSCLTSIALLNDINSAALEHWFQCSQSLQLLENWTFVCRTGPLWVNLCQGAHVYAF